MVKNKNVPLLVAAVICAISIITMTVALVMPGGKLAPAEFIPPAFEESAVQGIPNVPDGLGWSELDVQAYKASVCGVVTIENARAEVWFTNPVSNSVWLKLRVLDKNGNMLGETGIIKPGEYVQNVSLAAVPADGDTIGLKLMGYEPETYYSAGSATLNTTVRGGDSQ